jgi:acetoin utilization protein AcuB
MHALACMRIPAVSHYMTKQPFTIARTATITEAHQLMRQHKIRHLPVVDGDRLVGIVTQRDLHLLETLVDTQIDVDSIAVEEAMTAHPFVVTSDMALDEVLDIMAEHKYGSVVVCGRGGVEGIFTATDACRVFADVLRRQRDAA